MRIVAFPSTAFEPGSDATAVTCVVPMNPPRTEPVESMVPPFPAANHRIRTSGTG